MREAKLGPRQQAEGAFYLLAMRAQRGLRAASLLVSQSVPAVNTLTTVETTCLPSTAIAFIQPFVPPVAPDLAHCSEAHTRRQTCERPAEPAPCPCPPHLAPAHPAPAVAMRQRDTPKSQSKR
jgi:hypothetical protein